MQSKLCLTGNTIQTRWSLSMNIKSITTVRPNGQEFLVDSQGPQTKATGTFGIHLSTLTIKSTTGPQFIDLTELISEQLELSGIQEGNVFVYSRHTTAGIVIQENEPLLLKDMCQHLTNLASAGGDYHHNNFDVRTVNMCEDECANGHAHCQHLLVGCSEHIPVIEGKLSLGQWQRIFLLEMDRPRTRQVTLQFMGI